MSNWIYFESNIRNVIAGTDPMATYAIEDMVKNTAFTVFTENKDEILDEVNDKMRDRVRDPEHFADFAFVRQVQRRPDGAEATRARREAVAPDRRDHRPPPALLRAALVAGIGG